MKKTVRLSLFLALAIVLNIIESFIPLFNGYIPGLKLGLANIIVLFVLYFYSFKDALYISILRVLLVGILRTGLFSITFFFSLGGALCSCIFMYLSKKFLKLSMIGVSIVGSIMHSVGQILIASFIFKMSLGYYLPFLLILSIPTGIIVGLVSKKLLKYVQDNLNYIE